MSELSISTVKRLIENLLNEQIILEMDKPDKASHRGRKEKCLCLNHRYGHSIGINVEPAHIDLTVLNFSGEILEQHTYSLTDQDKKSVISEISQLAEEHRQHMQHAGKFLGLGVGITGLVDARRGIVHYCPNLPGWENVEITKELTNLFPHTVVVDDSVRMMALAEKRYGIAKGIANFLYIYIGEGVGAGIVLENRFYRGKNGISGEFGHMTIKQDGPLCNCGNHGCLEALVSSSAIIHAVQQALRDNIYSSLNHMPENALTIENISDAAENGDKLAAMIVSEVAENIGIGAADLMNVFDPGVIIFHGEVFENFKDILSEVTRLVRLRGIAAISRRTEFFIGKSMYSPGSLGAATAVIEKFVNNDLLNIN